MKNFINIASEEKPLMVDASSITGAHIYADKKELSLYNEKGQLMWINYEGFGVDPDTLVQKLAAAGNALVSFPLRHDDKEYAHFISPAAVTYATVTEVGKEGKLGAIIGVKGVGREESYGTTPEELQGLLEAVKAAGKTLIEYGPNAAHARWYNPAALYIDPTTVREIRDDGMQVNVYFEASGSLDVQIGPVNDTRNTRENELLNKFWNERGDDIKDLNDAWRKAQAVVKEEERQARLAFAQGIATANGALMQVPNTRNALYIQPGAFDYVTFHDDDRKDTKPEHKYQMSLQRQKTSADPYPDALRAYFNSSADRAAAFAAVTGTELPIKPAAARKQPDAPTP